MTKKIIPATIIVNGKELPVYHAITKKQMKRIIRQCKCPCHYEFDKVIICAHCTCRNVTREEWDA